VSEVVVVPRLELEVNLEDVSAAIEVAVRRLGYDSPTTQQKEAVTAFVKGNDVFACAMRAFLGCSMPSEAVGKLGLSTHPLWWS